MTRLIASSLAVAIGACAAVLGVALVLGPRLGVNGPTVLLAVVLVVLAPLDWIPVGLVGRLVARAPDVQGLQDQLVRLVFEALAATAIGVIGGNYLLGSPLPRGAGFVILVLALLLVSAPPVHWLLQTYRRA